MHQFFVEGRQFNPIYSACGPGEIEQHDGARNAIDRTREGIVANDITCHERSRVLSGQSRCDEGSPCACYIRNFYGRSHHTAYFALCWRTDCLIATGCNLLRQDHNYPNRTPVSSFARSELGVL